MIYIKKPYNFVRVQMNERNVKRTNHTMSRLLIVYEIGYNRNRVLMKVSDEERR